MSTAAEDRSIVVAELARGSGSPSCDVSYRRAVTLAPRLLREAALVVYVHAPLAVRHARNEERRRAGHGPPPAVLDELYSDDDFEEVAATEGWKVLRVGNADDSGPGPATEQILRHLGVS